MNKEQYMMSKTYNPLNVVYHYYLNHEKLNHKPLPPQELFRLLQQRGFDINRIIRDVFQEYDTKYNVTALLDEKGNLIRYV